MMSQLKPVALSLAVLGTLSLLAIPLLQRLRRAVPAVPPTHLAILDVSKWAVEYDDLLLGPVQGVAYCNWQGERVHVMLRNPVSGELHSLEAKGFQEVSLTSGENPTLRLVLHGRSPFEATVAAPTTDGLKAIKAADFETAKLAGGNSTSDAVVWKTGLADRDRVDVELSIEPYHTLAGTWRYVANPVTQRDADGYGRVGVFRFLEDRLMVLENGKPQRRGGFLGEQSGSETWTPLPAQIYDVEVLEEQAAFDRGLPKYRHASDSKVSREGNLRTLFIFGRDLPLDGSLPLTFLQSNDDGISYEVVAVAGAKDLKEEDAQRLEIGWRKATQGMNDKDAANFRRLDAVMVKATLTQKADAGPKSFGWGGAKGSWDLQYGDNTADVHFVRVFNEKESEQVTQLALPEIVSIEVDTPAGLNTSQIPVRLGSSGPITPPDGLMATKVLGSSFAFRTPPILFAAADDNTDSRPVNTVSVSVRKGSRVFAGVDSTKTQFLRVTMAAALASSPTTLWQNALMRAASCQTPKTSDRSNLARQPEQTFSGSGQTVDIAYGDHAAMLILRDAFLQAMRGQIEVLKSADGDDNLLDGWHDSMYEPVTKVSGFPLAAVLVKDRDGKEIPFSLTYSWEYATKTFQPYNTSDGLENWRKWRRSASRQALSEYRNTVQESLAATEKFEDCDWQELLKLTGSGFGRISSRLEPLLMTYQPEERLAVRDKTARIYVRNLDTLAERVQSIQALSSVRNKYIMLGVSGIVALPAVVWGGAAGAISSLIGGVAIFGADSGYEIYETYQQQEEVRFEFGASGQLGLDRFFDAQSRATPWWRTGASIFGQAVMLGAGVKLSLPDIRKGLAIWRGERIFREIESSGLAGVRALDPHEERDVAMFLLDARERVGINLAVGTRARYAAKIFDDLGQEAAGIAKPTVAKSLEDELAADAANAADDFQVPKAPESNPLQQAKTELSETELFQQARTDPTPSGLFQRASDKGILFHPGLPHPGIPWKVTLGGTEQTLELGEVIGQGAFFTTYRLKKIPDGLAVDPELGTDLVVKIFNKGSEELKAANAAHLPGINENVIQRMSYAQELLKSKGIRQLEFQGFEDAGFILQKRVDIESGNFRFLDGKKLVLLKGAERNKVFTKEMRQAVAELYKKFADNGLIWLDGHINNIYFELIDNKWTAGVLDQDLITNFESVEEGVYGHWFDLLQIRPQTRPISIQMPGDLKYSTAQSLMQKMFEMKGWMKFNWPTKTYESGLLDPNEVKEVFKDLPYVSPPAAKPNGAWLRPLQLRNDDRNGADVHRAEVGTIAPIFSGRKMMMQFLTQLRCGYHAVFQSPQWQACPA